MTEAAPVRGPELKAPAAVILGAARNPVTRYRRTVVALIAVTGLVLFAIALMIGFRPPKPVSKAPSDPDKTATAGGAVAGPDFGSLPKTYGESGGLIGQPPAPATLPNGETSPAAGSPGPTTSPPQPPVSPDVQQARDLARTVRTANPFFPRAAEGVSAQAAAPPAVPAFPSSQPTGAGDLQGSVSASALAPAPVGSTPAIERFLPASAVQNLQDAKRAFVAGAGQKQDYVADAYRRPLSPFEVKAGSIIPAALVTALNSDLPGEIIAQVTQGVYDHATGRTLLIPQGARLVGKYDSQVAYGQNRALIVWTRIILPDGRSIDLGVMTGADLSGASGLTDSVNGHIGLLTRAIALSTAITVGGAIAENASARSSGNLVLSDAAGGVSSQASQVGQRFMDRELNRQPTIMVRPGWPLTVLVSKDLVLEPY